MSDAPDHTLDGEASRLIEQITAGTTEQQVKEKKPRKRRQPPPLPVDDEPRLCADGCGDEVPRGKPTGRRKKFATRYCSTIFHQAKLAGWTETSPETARQFMVGARERKKHPIGTISVTDDAPTLPVSPVICECGCGDKARFASVACARKVNRGEAGPR